MSAGACCVWAATLIAVAAAPAARAQEAPAGHVETTPIEEHTGENGKKRKKGPKPTKVEKHAIATTEVGTFGIKGRIFANLELRQRADQLVVGSDGIARTTDVDSIDVTLDSARFSLLYENPAKWLMAEIELEAGDPDQVEVKDAYLLAEGSGLSFKAGNFKVPTSAIELESAWTLPSSRRGFVNDLLLNYLDVGDRRPGMQFAYQGRDGIEPALIVGVFQGSVLVEHVGEDRDVELLDAATLDSLTGAARGQIELGKFDIGVFYEHRVGSPAPFQTEHFPLIGADVVFDDEFGDDFGLRFWADAQYGESWYAYMGKPASEGAPWFLALRAIVAPRFGGTSDDMFYVEPFGSVGLLDPDMDVSSDWAHEFVIGCNVGFWDRARLSVQGLINETAGNFPQSYFGGPRPQNLALIVQVGMAF